MGRGCGGGASDHLGICRHWTERKGEGEPFPLILKALLSEVSLRFTGYELRKDRPSTPQHTVSLYLLI